MNTAMLEPLMDLLLLLFVLGLGFTLLALAADTWRK